MTEETLLTIFAAVGFVLGALAGYLGARPPRGPEPPPSVRGTASSYTPKPSAFTRKFYGR